jgi:Sulfotransferase family
MVLRGNHIILLSSCLLLLGLTIESYFGFQSTLNLSAALGMKKEFPQFKSCLDDNNDDDDSITEVKEFIVDKKPSRRLEFVHIPKTGGTVIESEAARHNISWSICHFGIRERVIDISMNETVCPIGSLKFFWPAVKKYHQCPWWHLPPQYFELHAVNPYAGADLFAVVRNPYERLLSEYYYFGTYILKKSETRLNDSAELNKWINSMMQKMATNSKAGIIEQNQTGNAAYFLSSGHFIPQYDFVFEHRRQLIKHILYFEGLEKDFTRLMKLYNLPMRLPQRQVRPSHSKKLTPYNLTKENLELIEKVYRNDFIEWKYDMISDKISQNTITISNSNIKRSKSKRLVQI